MVISVKDSIKLVGISIICFCAVFVCTFFINFYVDAAAVGAEVSEGMRYIYEAQLATAKLSCTLSGGSLSAISFLMLAFYVKLYVDGHARQLGILKAIGYKNGKIALKFWTFGLSVFIGAALGCVAGYLVMPFIYEQMAVEGLEISIRFHAWLPLVMVIAPTVVFSAFSCGYAYFALNRPVGEMLRGKVGIKRRLKKENAEQREVKREKERTFLVELGLKTISNKKMLAVFVAFACFCFSSMVQMGAAMYDLNTAAMGLMVLGIGVVLAVTTLFIAVTALVNGNIKNIAIMKAFGYSMKECALTVFSGYIPFALLGFAVGTVYQYGLLRVMVDVFFKEYSLDFSFNVAVFFITFAAFVVFYAAIMLIYSIKLGRISVKEVMTEN